MVSVLSIFVLGFFLGMRHSTDPDHVIAVTTIVSRERSVGPAVWIGALWGLGHTITISLVGVGIIVVGWVIPERLGLSMEFSVGVMLVLLGVLNLTGVLQWVNDSLTPASLAPSHSGSLGGHAHPHALDRHDQGSDDARGLSRGFFGGLGFYQTLRPLVVGIVHGLAGSAAVALLVLATIREKQWAIAYLLIFGVGTIVGMMLITSALAMPIAYTNRRFTEINRGLCVATGLISLGFGLFLTYHFGIASGLFTAHPQWVAR